MRKNLTNILKLLNLAERLKFELRHSWLSNGRRESVAEHSWRLCLLVVLLVPYLDQPIDCEKALKMAVIHDLSEAITGDVPTYDDIGDAARAQKHQAEVKAMQEIKQMLNNAVGDELYVLWQEFEAQTSVEAQFVMALDKLECQLQHNEADINTWNEVELARDLAWLDPYCTFDKTIGTLKEILVEAAEIKRQNKATLCNETYL